MSENSSYNLVYSTQNSGNKQKKNKATTSSKSNFNKTPRIRLEKKGRKGKTVTIIENLGIADSELKNILKKLQTHCGTGGTVKERHIELQGNWYNKALTYLNTSGYKIK